MKEDARSHERGAAVVEFAILFTMLLVLVFGMIEVGFIWLQKHFICHAVREGGRVGAKVAIYRSSDQTVTNLPDVKLSVEESIRARLEEAAFYNGKLDQLDIDIPTPASLLAGNVPCLQVSATLDRIDLLGIIGNNPPEPPILGDAFGGSSFSTLSSSSVFAIEKR